MSSAPKQPDCWQCGHHFITHEASFPYGCRAMNFKSHKLPCKEVFEASQNHCLLFLRKNATEASEP